MQALTLLVKEMRYQSLDSRARPDGSPSVSGDFDRDVEVYLRRKDELSQTQNTRTAVLQKKVSILEEENREMREQIGALEKDRKELTEQLHSLEDNSSLEELKDIIEQLQADIREKDQLIADMQAKLGAKADPRLAKSSQQSSKDQPKQAARPQTTKAVQKNPLWGDIRKELNRNLSPRSVSLEQKMVSLKKGQNAAKPQVKPLGSPDFMADLSRKYENMLAKYEQKATSRSNGKETQQLNAIKEQLGATGKQLSQMASRPVSSKQLPKKPADPRVLLHHGINRRK